MAYAPLPQFQYPQNALLDFTPVNQGINALSAMWQNNRKVDQFNSLFAPQQVGDPIQNDGWTTTATRPNPALAGMHPSAIAMARAAGPDIGYPMLARNLEHQSDLNLRQAQESRTAQMFPSQLQTAQTEAALKKRELDSPPLQPITVKENESVGFADRRNPGAGIQWVEPPISGQPSKAYRDARDKERGDSRAKAENSLPMVETNASLALETIDKLKSHPGRPWATGVMGSIPPLPGTSARGFVALHNQAKGKIFLEAYNSLRGAGAISEGEGKVATEAQGRMDRAQNQKDYDDALEDVRKVINTGVERTRSMAGGVYPPQKQNPAKPAEIRIGYGRDGLAYFDDQTGQWVPTKGAKSAAEAEQMARKMIGQQQPQNSDWSIKRVQ